MISCSSSKTGCRSRTVRGFTDMHAPKDLFQWDYDYSRVGKDDVLKCMTKGTDARVRVVLADDHKDVLRETRVLLSFEFVVLSSVTDGSALIDAARRWKPDVVISDIRMPGVNGIEACQRIAREGYCSASIILTTHNEKQLIQDALRAGIRGYVLKVDAGEELVSAVHSLLRGSAYLSRGVFRKWTEFK